MNDAIDRRHFLAAAALAAGRHAPASARGEGPSDKGPATPPARPLLTRAADFVDVSRGNPKPFTLKGEALAKARLTPETWRLEIVGDGNTEVARPARIEDGTALDLAALQELGKAHGVRYLKAMQCNNIPAPLGQGLWEGLPLRDVLRRVGKLGNVRRLYYWGFHNDDPAQRFQSSLAFNRALESPPSEPPPLVAYRLNGEPIPPQRGGPVRMIVPWAHGFKSIKWLQRIVLTNDYQANDTYALQNNDPESYLKTAAYLGDAPPPFKAGGPVVVEGTAVAGWSGLKRVEYWARPGAEMKLDDDDPVWKTAVWRPCDLAPPPDDWEAALLGAAAPRDVWGFDSATGQPRSWPLPFSTVGWSAKLEGLRPGSYEFRARAVDLNGCAQPEPRPYQKSGLNAVPCQVLVVSS